MFHLVRTHSRRRIAVIALSATLAYVAIDGIITLYDKLRTDCEYRIINKLVQDIEKKTIRPGLQDKLVIENNEGWGEQLKDRLCNYIVSPDRIK